MRYPPAAVGVQQRRFRLAMAEQIGAPLGLSVERAAYGMFTIVNNNMVNAIRRVSVERGYDPRDFVLNCAGGATGAHITALAGDTVLGAGAGREGAVARGRAARRSPPLLSPRHATTSPSQTRGGRPPAQTEIDPMHLPPAQRASIASELGQIHEGLVGLANARDSAGHALFGGDSAGNAYLDASGGAAVSSRKPQAPAV